jgi:UV DNA damage endonuclease
MTTIETRTDSLPILPFSGATTIPPMRFGFAAKVMGQEGLKSNDTRRWQNNPHLRISIGYLQDIFTYLEKTVISMYRMSSDIAPYVTHPDLPQFHGQITEAAEELKELGQTAKRMDLRLSMHPSQFIVLNSPDPKLVEKSVQDLLAGALILDAMELGPEAVLVIHVGGTYGDPTTGCDRWVQTYQNLPEPVKRRLVLENDDLRYSAADVLGIHDRTGVPLIFDYQHFWCNNPEGFDLVSTVDRFLQSWRVDVRPKIHYSSPNTSMREVQQRDRKTGKPKKAMLPPIWTGHADFVNPFEFATFMRMIGQNREARAFDVMLEAKMKDVALLRLRRDLPRYAPDVALRFGLAPNPPDAASDDIQEELAEMAEGES